MPKSGAGMEAVRPDFRLGGSLTTAILVMLGIVLLLHLPSVSVPLPLKAFSRQDLCSSGVHLGPTGLWEGPWNKYETDSVNLETFPPNGDGTGGASGAAPDSSEAVPQDDSNGESASASASASNRRSLMADVWNHLSGSEGLFGRSKRLVVRGGENGENVGEGDGREGVTAGLDATKFNLTDPLTLAFARLVNEYMDHWVAIEGVTSGVGKRGAVKARMFPVMAKNKNLIPCTAHVRIIKGKVFFRYGAFLDERRKLLRANQGVKMIQEAVTEYNLKDLQAELFLNVCEEAMGFDNSLSPGRSGFPVFSTHLTGGVTDIAVPDPADLTFSVHDLRPPPGMTWRKMASNAVFRGASTNFDLKAMNFEASPRFRLHRMTSVRPDLVDARITMWGSHDQGETKQGLVRDGFYLGAPLSPEELSSFKYFLVADDAVGTTGMCEALARGQVAVRQTSPFIQFFDPMLLPGVHHIQVEHSFSDLFQVVEWMTKQDSAMQSVVAMANNVAPLVCSWKTRTLYWAIAISKYVNLALEDPTVEVALPKVCDGRAIEEPSGMGDKCRKANEPCGDFCTKDVPESDWTWLSADALQGVPKLDPLEQI